jgi:fibronectin type 3 domain-containing protein
VDKEVVHVWKERFHDSEYREVKLYQEAMRTQVMRHPSIAVLGLIFSISIVLAQGKGEKGESQIRRSRLAFVARTSPDSIVLRWAPTTAAVWDAANRFGYGIRRVTLDKTGKPVPNSAKEMTAAPIRPWTLDVWKKLAPRDDRFAAIGAQSLHGEHFTTKEKGINGGEDMRNGVDELTNRFAFALVAADNDAIAAEGLGLRLVDLDVRPGFSYVYRIVTAGKDSTHRPDTAFTMATPAPWKRPPAVEHAQTETGEKMIRLTWDNLPAGRGYSGFYISRADEGSGKFTRVNSMPYVTAKKKLTAGDRSQSFTDTNVVNYIRYRYRIEGVTPFAELSEPAETEGFAGDRTPPPPPVIMKPEQLSLSSFKVNWDMPSTSSDLAGFAIFRSGFALKGYHLLYPKGDDIHRAMSQLLPSSTRSFVDQQATMIEPYYIVASVDTAGNMAQSLPAYGEIIDTVPPAMPVGLNGTIDTNGIVRLRWRLGPEKNLIGYRVVWANSRDHEFSMRTNEAINDTSFVDTVEARTLTEQVFYRVMAVNARKFFSKPSEILALRRPDLVPPESPIFTDVSVSDSSVVLRWNPSHSEDVRIHHLSRRVAGENPWVVLATLARGDSTYVDRAVVARTTYEYSIDATDSSGHVSLPSPTVAARSYDTGVRPGVKGLKATVETTSGKILLTWQYVPKKGDIVWYVLYRAVGNGPLTEYASIESGTTEYRDLKASVPGTYRYAMKVVGQGGIESSLSSEISLIR